MKNITLHSVIQPRSRFGLTVVYALLAFQCLAFMRALVPGICATQISYRDSSATASCCVAIDGKCDPNDEETRIAEDVVQTPCAFCTLTIVPARTLSAVHVQPQQSIVTDYVALHTQRLSSSAFSASMPHRGPPATVA